MQIICRKSFHFQQHEILDNTKTGEKVAIVKQEFRVYPSYVPQLVPDWIEENDLFQMAVDDDSITKVAVLSESKKDKAKKSNVAEPQTMGWGASAAGLTLGK
jgi:hypothetical protein